MEVEETSRMEARNTLASWISSLRTLPLRPDLAEHHLPADGVFLRQQPDGMYRHHFGQLVA